MDEKLITKWKEALKSIVALHKKIEHIDKSLSQLHPIAIVKNNTFYVFDYDKLQDSYHFVMMTQVPNMQIPDKILASFPLDFYYMKPAAVVSEDALYELEKQVFVFHEFVHCYQYENGEQDIKASLEIYNKYQKENNFMWEINHSFPYTNDDFTQKVNSLILDYNEKDHSKIAEFYGYIKDISSDIDYEYLIWQEFKEGYARFVENNIRAFLGLELNNNTPKAPFDRTAFYWLGSNHIDYIINAQNKNIESLNDLFNQMYVTDSEE